MSTEVIINLGEATEGQIRPLLEAKLRELKQFIDEEFTAPKSGREYRRPGGGTYRASAPGEPPAIRTGQLRASVSDPQVMKVGSTLVGKITISAPYAEFLERGTSRVAPRPFIQPAVEEILRRRT